MTFFLTNREYQILEILTNGLTNKEIAIKLNISVRTVESILHNIFNKTQSINRLDLVVKYKKMPYNFKLKVKTIKKHKQYG